MKRVQASLDALLALLGQQTPPTFTALQTASSEFVKAAADADKRKTWIGFLRRRNLRSRLLKLADLICSLDTEVRRALAANSGPAILDAATTVQALVNVLLAAVPLARRLKYKDADIERFAAVVVLLLSSGRAVLEQSPRPERRSVIIPPLDAGPSGDTGDSSSSDAEGGIPAGPSEAGEADEAGDAGADGGSAGVDPDASAKPAPHPADPWQQFVALAGTQVLAADTVMCLLLENPSSPTSGSRLAVYAASILRPEAVARWLAAVTDALADALAANEEVPLHFLSAYSCVAQRLLYDGGEPGSTCPADFRRVQALVRDNAGLQWKIVALLYQVLLVAVPTVVPLEAAAAVREAQREQQQQGPAAAAAAMAQHSRSLVGDWRFLVHTMQLLLCGTLEDSAIRLMHHQHKAVLPLAELLAAELPLTRPQGITPIFFGTLWRAAAHILQRSQEATTEAAQEAAAGWAALRLMPKLAAVLRQQPALVVEPRKQLPAALAVWDAIAEPSSAVSSVHSEEELVVLLAAADAGVRQLPLLFQLRKEWLHCGQQQPEMRGAGLNLMRSCFTLLSRIPAAEAFITAAAATAPAEQSPPAANLAADGSHDTDSAAEEVPSVAAQLAAAAAPAARRLHSTCCRTVHWAASMPDAEIRELPPLTHWEGLQTMVLSVLRITLLLQTLAIEHAEDDGARQAAVRELAGVHAAHWELMHLLSSKLGPVDRIRDSSFALQWATQLSLVAAHGPAVVVGRDFAQQLSDVLKVMLRQGRDPVRKAELVLALLQLHDTPLQLLFGPPDQLDWSLQPPVMDPSMGPDSTPSSLQSLDSSLQVPGSLPTGSSLQAPSSLPTDSSPQAPGSSHASPQAPSSVVLEHQQEQGRQEEAQEEQGPDAQQLLHSGSVHLQAVLLSCGLMGDLLSLAREARVAGRTHGNMQVGDKLALDLLRALECVHDAALITAEALMAAAIASMDTGKANSKHNSKGGDDNGTGHAATSPTRIDFSKASHAVKAILARRQQLEDAAAQLALHLPPRFPLPRSELSSMLDSFLASRAGILPGANKAAALLEEYWGQAQQQMALQLELAQVSATRPCSYLACRNLQCPDLTVEGKSNRQCGTCSRVFYCCSECASTDWRAIHKRVCQQLAVMGRERRKSPGSPVARAGPAPVAAAATAEDAAAEAKQQQLAEAEEEVLAGEGQTEQPLDQQQVQEEEEEQQQQEEEQQVTRAG